MDNNKLLKFSIAILIALSILLAFAYKNLSYNKKAAKIYSQGLLLYNQEKYQDAYYNFQKINKNSNLYTLALLKQFQAANKLGDKKTALVKLDQLTKRKTNELIRPYILYNELLFNENTGKYSKNQLYKKYIYIYTKYPKSDFAKASSIKAALLLEDKNQIMSKKYFLQYLSYAPSGKYSLLALDELKKLKNLLQEDEMEILADTYIQNNMYSEALPILKAGDFSKNWYKISVCYKNLKNPEGEKEAILKGLALKVSSVEEKDINSAIDRLIKITNSNKIQTLQDMSVQFKMSNSYPTILYKLAESLTSIRSIKTYEHISGHYPDSIWAPNSLWEVFWYNYEQKRYKACKSIAFEYERMYKNEKDAARISYWLGKVYLKSKNQKLAKAQFNKVIENYPLSYYAFLSSRQLKLSQEAKIFNKKKIITYNIDKLPKYIFKKDKTMQYLLQNCDWQTIDELKLDDPYIKSWILNKKGFVAESITTSKEALEDNIEKARNEENSKEENKLTFDDFRLKLIYPIFYSEEINKYSAQNDVSPYLFLSLIREESHFNPKIKSPVGALGLSQIMPATASHIEKRNVSKEELLDEENNIKIGEKYFKYLIDKYDGNIYYAIISYNAGFGNLEKWLNDPTIFREEIDEFCENIPYFETKTYIKKVLSSYWVYQNVYSMRNVNI